MSVIPMGIVARTIRALVAEILSNEFIVGLNARGLSELAVFRHVLGLFAGQPGAREFRRILSETRDGRAPTVRVEEALAAVRRAHERMQERGLSQSGEGAASA